MGSPPRGRKLLAALKNGKRSKNRLYRLRRVRALACPTLARQRKPDQLWQVRLGGRTSKRRRQALPQLNEDVIKQVIGWLTVNLKKGTRRKTDSLSTHGHLIDEAAPAF